MDRSDDWCFTLKDGYIDKWKIGGIDCYQEVGISYWNEQDGHRLSTDLKESFEMPGGKEKYWDSSALSDFKDHYKIQIRECSPDDIVEIDTFNELKKIDKTYDV